MTCPPASLLPLFAQTTSGSNGALITFLVYTAAVFVIAWYSNRLQQKKESFLSEYFLGSRSLGTWAFALTFAATSASGGTFTGFPSLVYAHGWSVALWISSYLVVPICGLGLLAKRINQVARIGGSITVPDVFRDRFQSARFGLLATLLIVFFMTFNLVAQFKAGAEILRTLLQDVGIFQWARAELARFDATQLHLFAARDIEPGYVICLLAFAAAVIVYTTYGGFHAVVWTDVMQGLVMVMGVLIMLPLALYQVGGLESATREMAKMTPPRVIDARLSLETASDSAYPIPTGTWLTLPPQEGSELPRLLRVSRQRTIPAGQTSVDNVPLLELTTPSEIERQLSRLAVPVEELNGPLTVEVTRTLDYRYGKDQPGVYVTGPGPQAPNRSLSPEEQPASSGFLPLSLAISFFFMWAISGAGQPSNMVRQMAFNSTTTLRRSIFTVAIYFSLIYFPIVLIFCCARVLLPGMDEESDRIMPEMAVFLTSAVNQPWLAGVLIAAPFAAVMSTVDSFLLMISSAIVRDFYQRNINPEVSESRIKLMSYAVTFVVGAGAMFAAVSPPRFLQDIIVYTGSGLASCFLIPMVVTLYWPRVTLAGAMAGMLGGFLSHLSLYVIGYVHYSEFRALKPLGIDPIIWGLATSLLLTLAVTPLTPQPPRKLIERYFMKQAPRKASVTT